VRKIEKHEIQILDCDGKLKDNENWLSAETSRVSVGYTVNNSCIGHCCLLLLLSLVFS